MEVKIKATDSYIAFREPVGSFIRVNGERKKLKNVLKLKCLKRKEIIIL